VKGYKDVTNDIISKLQQGTIPWRQTWRSGLPCNAMSRQPYKGINVWLLSNHQYQSNLWLTFNQAKLLDGCVNKGEHGRQIVYWALRKKIWTDDLGEEHRDSIPLLRTYTVFNIEQTTIEIKSNGNGFDPISKAQDIVDCYEGGPEIVTGEPKYSLISDTVSMPLMSAFDSADEYYCVFFHELSHSTGHRSRLNRLIRNPYGSNPYAEEEIVAEMSASFLSGIAGIDVYSKTIDNSAAYIQHWCGRFGDNAKLIVRLSSQAQKSADWILGNRTSNDSDRDSEE